MRHVEKQREINILLATFQQADIGPGAAGSPPELLLRDPGLRPQGPYHFADSPVYPGVRRIEAVTASLTTRPAVPLGSPSPAPPRPSPSRGIRPAVTAGVDHHPALLAQRVLARRL